MAFDKAIQSGKEHRKPFRGAKRFDSSCRNHGGCEWCFGNRTASSRRREEASRDELKDYELLYDNISIIL